MKNVCDEEMEEVPSKRACGTRQAPSRPRMTALRRLGVLAAAATAACGEGGGPGAGGAGADTAVTATMDYAVFQPVEAAAGGLFGTESAFTNAWADYDGDGDLDLFVGLRSEPNRLYRNDGGLLVDVAAAAGLADLPGTRSAAWGDFDGDGRPDLYVGFVPDSSLAALTRLYHSEGDGRFTDVAPDVGVALTEGSTRQVSWIDYDSDGDVDLFVALRDLPNRLFRNDGGTFVDVAGDVGVADDRRSVGAVWLDVDEDGDLDLLVANMDGDANGLFRNDGGTFVDVAEEAGLADGGRGLGDPEHGTVRPCVTDFDSDGHLDVSMANYGPNAIYHNKADGTFRSASEGSGLTEDARYDTCAWADYDSDGREDLYVNGTITGGRSYRDYLFRNRGDGTFEDMTPAELLSEDADHGVQWADFDGDGDLDLSLVGVAGDGMHHLFRNLSRPEVAGQSLQVMVLDAAGGYTLPGAEVRVYSSRSGRRLGTRLVDTGSGYNTQNAAPVHFGLPLDDTVSVEVTTMSAGGRRMDRLEDIALADYAGRWLEVRIDGEGRIVR